MDDIATHPVGRLYSSRQIGVATFLGSPAAGGWLVRQNERLLSRPNNGARWFWYSLAASVALLVISFALPENFPPLIIPVAYTVAIEQAAKKYYTPIVEAHLASGGALASWWIVVGVGLLFLLLFCILVFGIIYLVPTK